MRSSKLSDVDEKKRVGLWIRVSTDMQVESESPAHQEKRGRYYAEAKGWTIVEVYRLEVQSGNSVMNHPETQRMLNDLRSDRITGGSFQNVRDWLATLVSCLNLRTSFETLTPM